MKSKSALIIGGGFAGLSAAVFLDALGFKIRLLEKKPILGGRAYSFLDKKIGSWVDNGQHLLIGAYHETLKLLENIGAKRHLLIPSKTEVPLITEEGQPTSFNPSSLPPPLNLLGGFLKLKGLNWRDKWGLVKLGRELQNLKKGKPRFPLDQNVDEWLEDVGQSQRARTNFWDPLTLATLNDDPKVAGAGMLAAVLVKGFLGSNFDSRLIIPNSPLNDLLAKPAREYLEIRGQKIETGMSVKKIHVLDNQVQGVELESGELIRADYYISAVPFASLLRLIPEGFVESEPYFCNLKKLKNSPIVSINLWFDQDLLDSPFVGIGGKKVHWYFNKNKIYDESHPPYHVMGVISGAYQFVDLSKDEIMKIALDELGGLFPKAGKAHLIHSLVNKERKATLSPQVGSEAWRPPQKSPFDNFYVIGDWTSTGLPATIESAVLSARLAVDDLEKRGFSFSSGPRSQTGREDGLFLNKESPTFQ